jgi:metal-responsive CopG/Arc/MetJ family transcriptional regulator
MGNTVRITISLPADLSETMDKFAERNGLSKSMVVTLAARAGFQAIAIASDPQWKEYFEKMISQGVPVNLPDGSVMGSEEL